MDIFRMRISDESYYLPTGTSKDEKPSKREIFILPPDTPPFDFKLEFCDTPPYLAGALAAYFLSCVRGIPIYEWNFSTPDRVVYASCVSGHACVTVPIRVPCLTETSILGCDVIYADTDGRRYSFFGSGGVKDGVLKNLELASDLPRPLVAAYRDGDVTVVPDDSPFDLSALPALFGFLLRIGELPPHGKLRFHGGVMDYVTGGTGIRLSIRPKCEKIN